jgi:hypothetical protein
MRLKDAGVVLVIKSSRYSEDKVQLKTECAAVWGWKINRVGLEGWGGGGGGVRKIEHAQD